jgi:hypothetical protein
MIDCFHETKPKDDHGRSEFWIYWVGRVGASHERIGVRGQIFKSSIDEYERRARERGREVRRVDSYEEACALLAPEVAEQTAQEKPS